MLARTHFIDDLIQVEVVEKAVCSHDDYVSGHDWNRSCADRKPLTTIHHSVCSLLIEFEFEFEFKTKCGLSETSIFSFMR